MSKKLCYLVLFSFTLCTISCVSSKKHKDLQLLKDHYKAQLDTLKKGEDEVQYTEYDYRQMEAKVKNTKADMDDLQESFDYLKQ